MGRSQARIGVGDPGVGEVEQIVPNAVVQCEPIGYAPGILEIESIFVDVRSGKRAVGSRAGKCLGEAERIVGSEIGVAVKCIGTAEIAGKEIIDVLEIEVEAGLESVAAAHMRKALRPLDGAGV